MLGGLWEELRAEWAAATDDPRPPVFILVCKNTADRQGGLRVAGRGQAADGHPAGRDRRASATRTARVNTIRVDSKVVHETDTGHAKSDEIAVDAVHARHGRQDATGRATGRAGRSTRGVRGAGDEARPAAASAGPGRALHRQRRHAHRRLGLQHGHAHRRPAAVHVAAAVRAGGRPRAAAASYEVGEDGLLTEEVAKVFGVPFEVIPFKANRQRRRAPPPKRHHVHALPAKARFEITLPARRGLPQAIRNRVTVDWASVAAAARWIR